MIVLRFIHGGRYALRVVPYGPIREGCRAVGFRRSNGTFEAVLEVHDGDRWQFHSTHETGLRDLSTLEGECAARRFVQELIPDSC